MSLKNVLIDTDIGPDCDGVAALAMLNIYANRGLSNVAEFANRYKESQPESACSMCRRILAAQADKSVEFISIGLLNNLSNC